MPRKKLTISDMMSQPYYKSILVLTHEFELCSDDEPGLQQIHYRYALQENPYMSHYYKKKMKKFFGNNLEILFKQSDRLEEMGLQRRIYRNCIKEGTHLSFYLKNLVDAGILIRTRGKDKKYRYMKNYDYDLIPIDVICKQMKQLSAVAIEPMTESIFQFGNYYPDIGVFFDTFFIAVPELFFNPSDDFSKEFKEAFDKFKYGVTELAKFLRKNTPPNQKMGEESKMFEASHQYGIYILLELFSDKGKRELKRYIDETEQMMSSDRS